MLAAALGVSLTSLAIAAWVRTRARSVAGESPLIIQTIVDSFSRRIASYDEKVSYAISIAQQASDEARAKQPPLEAPQTDTFTRAAESALGAVTALTKMVRDLASKVSFLNKGHDDLVRQISSLDGRYRGLLPEADRRTLLPVSSEAAIARLTPTEVQVIKTIAQQGPKSSGELRPVIGKTREHTGRLMKKLHVEGYVDRESTIPFRYSISERVKNSVERSLKEEKDQPNANA